MNDLGQSKKLVLVPTAIEANLLVQELGDQHRVELCGFGPVVAAARTSFLLEQLRPQQVVLVGIAGCYAAVDKPLHVGQAYQFSEVTCLGIGVGEGPSFRSAEQIGWHHWSQEPIIGDRLSLQNETEQELGLLSVCSASSTATEAQTRSRRYLQVSAEDMEGFAVAAACRLASVPLVIVRGISNVAGDRDHSGWQIESAMREAARISKAILESSTV